MQHQHVIIFNPSDLVLGHVRQVEEQLQFESTDACCLRHRATVFFHRPGHDAEQRIASKDAAVGGAGGRTSKAGKAN